MALPHAQPLDVIDIGTAAQPTQGRVSSSLIKTPRLQLLHLVLPAHRDQPLHHVANESVLHCLAGIVEVTMPSGVRTLRPGQLVLLPASQPHGLRARTDCVLLQTLLLHDGNAGDGGGAGHQPQQLNPPSDAAG